MQQTIYLATANDEAAWKKDNDDLFKVLAWSKPQDAEDTDAPKACKLESYEATPSYEM
jgi:branched-chain amino acid transport system substrate-binding protein